MRPILFSTEMVRAILAGNKTQTRRVVKGSSDSPFENLKTRAYITHGQVANFKIEDGMPRECFAGIKCPYGKIGDTLWVRESFSIGGKDESTRFYIYKTDVEAGQTLKFKPSIHMPKSACRLFLRIKDIRVERLQDITPMDAQAEGIEMMRGGTFWWKNYLDKGLPGHSSAVQSFKSLWQSINGEQSWNDNPWVWVIEFEVLPVNSYQEALKILEDV